MSVDEFPIYPLRFQPVFRDYVWGGERLKTRLKKSTNLARIAESWEIVDHQDTQSVVTNGPLAGWTLQGLVSRFGEKLVGSAVWPQINAKTTPEQLRGRFPLLIKFLDAKQTLSVQVHPNDLQAAQQNPPDLGKTEAWYILECQSGARIYAGLREGVGKDRFLAAIQSGELEDCLASFSAESGQCLLIPAGTQHAIGSGLLILEVQQASNTTFRVYDWERMGVDGRPRPLHIEQAVAVTDFTAGPVLPSQPEELKGGGRCRVRCPFFEVNEWRAGDRLELGCRDRFEIAVVLSGSIQIGRETLQPAETVLLPPTDSGYHHVFSEDAVLLQIRIPNPERS